LNDPENPRDFATTQWSLVAAAHPGEENSAPGRAALETLCRLYWYPLYAFVRHTGRGPDDAEDLTQAFFTRVIEKGFGSPDPARGRFRSYLLGAMKNFLANEHKRSATLKRGGAVRFVEWDAMPPEARYAATAAPADPPELLFDREWAETTVAGALRDLRAEMVENGKGEQFDALKGCLTGKEDAPRAELAKRLGLSENAVAVATHRLRQHYRRLMRAAVEETVGNAADLDDELRYLRDVLRKR